MVYGGCITKVGGSRWAEWLDKNQEAFIREWCLRRLFSLLRDLTASKSDFRRLPALSRGDKMRMREVLALLCVLMTCGAQKRKQEVSCWDSRVESGNGETCSNLTQVLDNWKFAIVTQVKDLLVNDHASVLPEYSRIKPLSDAVDDLYRQFNSLKEALGKLTHKFDSMEAFVDDLKDGRVTRPQVQRRLPFVGLRSPLRAQMRAPIREIRRNRALIRPRRRGLKRP